MTYTDNGRCILITNAAGATVGAIYQAPYSMYTPYNLVFDGRDRGHFASIDECKRVVDYIIAAQ